MDNYILMLLFLRFFSINMYLTKIKGEDKLYAPLKDPVIKNHNSRNTRDKAMETNKQTTVH